MAEKILSSSEKAVTRGIRLPVKCRMLPQRSAQMRSLLRAVFVLCAVFAAQARAGVVEIQTAEHLTATADYRQGKPGKPAVLVLHGFLQTREFGTVKNLADMLADAGYSVLAPNLSLGISRRKQSLACEALHLHDMAGDLKEIQQWVKWLRGRGHRRIVGLGHSFGATQLLAWREQYRQPQVDIIAVSLVASTPITLDAQPVSRGMPAAPVKVRVDLSQAPLSFCKSYPAPAERHASYARWDEARILAALKKTGGRADVVLGSEDSYHPADWGNRLAKAQARVHLIEGANHFMDGTHEFDLHETILGVLAR